MRSRRATRRLRLHVRARVTMPRRAPGGQAVRRRGAGPCRGSRPSLVVAVATAVRNGAALVDALDGARARHSRPANHRRRRGRRVQRHAVARAESRGRGGGGGGGGLGAVPRDAVATRSTSLAAAKAPSSSGSLGSVGRHVPPEAVGQRTLGAARGRRSGREGAEGCDASGDAAAALPARGRAGRRHCRQERSARLWLTSAGALVGRLRRTLGA